MGYRLFTVVVLLLTLLATPASGSEYVRFDLQWWNSMSRVEQMRAVQGIITGEQYAYLSAEMEDANMLVDRHMYSAAAELERHQWSLTFSRPFGIYADALTDFYTRHPHSITLVGAVMACFADTEPPQCKEMAKYE